MSLSSVSPVQKGQLFTLPASPDSAFEKKHGALSRIIPDDTDNFYGKIAGAKQQVVFDIRQPSTFSINGRKIKLDIPEGAAQARYIVSYQAKSDGDFDVKVKVDFQTRQTDQGQNTGSRIKFNEFSLADTLQDNFGLVVSERKQKPLLAENQSLSMEYLKYKCNKSTTSNSGNDSDSSSSSSTSERVSENSSTSPAMSSRGLLVTSKTRVEASLLTLPIVAQAAALNDKYQGADESTKQEVAREIATFKQQQIFPHLQSCQNWSDTLDLSKAIAVLHGKPNYGDGVRTYADRLLTDEFIGRLKDLGIASPDATSDAIKADLVIAATLPMLGEAVVPAELIRSGGRLSPEQKQRYIDQIPHQTCSMIQQKFPHLTNFDQYAKAVTGENTLGQAALILRSIAAMDQPREYRKGHEDCDEQGKFKPETLIAALRADIESKGRDSKVTEVFIEAYSKAKGITNTAVNEPNPDAAPVIKPVPNVAPVIELIPDVAPVIELIPDVT